MSQQPDPAADDRQQRMAQQAGLEVTRSEVVKVADVALTTSTIHDRVFVECLILGPAVIAPLDGITFDGCAFDGDSESMFLTLPDEQNRVLGVVGLRNAHFYGCRFQNVSILGKAADLEQFRSSFPFDDEHQS